MMYLSVSESTVQNLIGNTDLQLCNKCRDAKQTVLLHIAGKCVADVTVVHATTLLSSYKAALPDLSMHVTGLQCVYSGLF